MTLRIALRTIISRTLIMIPPLPLLPPVRHRTTRPTVPQTGLQAIRPDPPQGTRAVSGAKGGAGTRAVDSVVCDFSMIPHRIACPISSCRTDDGRHTDVRQVGVSAQGLARQTSLWHAV